MSPNPFLRLEISEAGRISPVFYEAGAERGSGLIVKSRKGRFQVARMSFHDSTSSSDPPLLRDLLPLDGGRLAGSPKVDRQEIKGPW